MIEVVTNIIKPVFEKLDLLEYLRVSYSDKADFQINSVFSIAKDKKLNPNVIGEEIVKEIQNLKKYDDSFKSVEFVKPGFINIFISDKLINNYLNNGITVYDKSLNEITYFLDYGGPNVAKPLHIGHLRPAIIGESLKRILKFKGYNVISDVHLGDYGLQIGQVIYGILKENKRVEDIDIEYLNYIYPLMSALCKENEEVYEECKKITFDFQHGKYREYYNRIKEISVKDIKRLYDYLGVSFDMWLGEIDSEGYVPKLMESLNSKNLISIDDEAKVVNVKKEDDNKEMPPVIVEKSDGSIMYATTDLAAIYERVEKYNPEYILYVVDARQSLHFEQIFRVAGLLDLTKNTKLEHIPFGTINGSDGKPFKTRSGDTLKLDELINLTKENFLSKREENKNMSNIDLDKIVNAIIKYADLQNNREKSYSFDISKFSDVSGKTGPYVIYSALRIKRIIESNNTMSDKLSDKIYNEIDRSLRFKLLELDKYVDRSIADRFPSHIAEYLYDLCNIVNSFYQNINISKITEEEMKSDYLNVLKKAYEVIESCLDMLIIKIPSQM